VVRNLTDFGAFVEITPGVDGLVHISDMSWTRRISHPSEVVQKGETVEAVITSIDVLNQRISLSMKELLPNEWEEYANAHGVGNVVGGTITNITDFGVFVELAPGVEGLCHISEVDRDPGIALAEIFVPGQHVACRILRIDWNENRIGLSMHGIAQEDAEALAESATSEEAESGDTAMAAALSAAGVVDQTRSAEPDDEDAAGETAPSGDEEQPPEAGTAGEPAPEEQAEASAEEESLAEAGDPKLEEAEATTEAKATTEAASEPTDSAQTQDEGEETENEAKRDGES
jgi:small subunit ribosomal protein S1